MKGHMSDDLPVRSASSLRRNRPATSKKPYTCAAESLAYPRRTFRFLTAVGTAVQRNDLVVLGRVIRTSACSWENWREREEADGECDGLGKA